LENAAGNAQIVRLRGIVPPSGGSLEIGKLAADEIVNLLYPLFPLRGDP
jgi:hypothetical protein